MPHIHAQPNQHDMTVSAYMLLSENDEWRCLVHFHKKMDKLMQTGGHIELDQTPWQALAQELEEEVGYQLSETQLLQPTPDPVKLSRTTVHPVPFHVNTHNVGDEHYHSDLCYGFVVTGRPQRPIGEGESDDLRWTTIEELRTLAQSGEALQDVYDIYEFLLRHLDDYARVPAGQFSLGKPTQPNIVYSRGKPSESRS